MAVIQILPAIVSKMLAAGDFCHGNNALVKTIGGQLLESRENHRSKNEINIFFYFFLYV